MNRYAQAAAAVRLGLLLLATTALAPAALHAQAPADDFVPVTDAMLQDPAPEDWPMWRRTLDGWGYSPLDQIDRGNVGDLRMVWSRGLAPGSNQGTPLVYRGVMYMPNPGDVIQALDAVTGDLRWEHRRDLPDDVSDHVSGLSRTNRNVAIHDRFIIDTSVDDYVFAPRCRNRRAGRGRRRSSTTAPCRPTSRRGPIVAGGKVVSGRGCMPEAGPERLRRHRPRRGDR